MQLKESSKDWRRKLRARPAELPVQALRAGDQPKAAKALGLDVPPTLLVRADEVIE
jgi:hypothetical protein